MENNSLEDQVFDIWGGNYPFIGTHQWSTSSVEALYQDMIYFKDSIAIRSSDSLSSYVLKVVKFDKLIRDNLAVGLLSNNYLVRYYSEIILKENTK